MLTLILNVAVNLTVVDLFDALFDSLLVDGRLASFYVGFSLKGTPENMLITSYLRIFTTELFD